MEKAAEVSFGAIGGLVGEWEPFLEARLGEGDGASVLVEFPGPKVGFFWHVERIAITGPDQEVAFYVSAVNDILLIEYSYICPNIADESSPLYIPEGQPFIARFLGTNPVGTIVTVHIQGKRYSVRGEGEWVSNPPAGVAGQ